MLQLVGSSGGTVSNKYSVDYAVGEVAVLFTGTSKTLNLGLIQPGNILTLIVPAIPEASLKIYEFVSANNDGKNETFYINGINQFPENNLIIFNKEGTVVFEQKNYDNSWNGGSLPSDNYFYIFRTERPVQEWKGGLVLTR